MSPQPHNAPTWLFRLPMRWGDAEAADAFADYAEDKYIKTAEERGRVIALFKALTQVAQVLVISSLNRLNWSLAMFRNIFKIAVRNLKRQKGYTAINLTGLAIGMASCLLILLWVADEFSYDRFHPQADRVYRMVTRGQFSDRTLIVPKVPAPMAQALVNDFPEVLDAVRIGESSTSLFSNNDRRFFENGLLYADPAFLRVFGFQLLEGDPQTALDAPHSLLVTPDIAKKYFGDESPVGQTLRFQNTETFTITGVIAPAPGNSHIPYTMVASFQTLIQRNPGIMRWMGWNYLTYILLDKGVDYQVFEAKLAAFNEKYVGQLARSMGVEISNTLQPLTAIHLHSHMDDELSANGDIRTVYALTAIAAFVLLLACINFMNLSTAKSARRAREVGLRKVVGAMRRGLMAQFLGESMTMTLFALVLALVLCAAALPYFNTLAAKQLHFSRLLTPQISLGMLTIVLLAGLAAGSYPSLLLSRFHPVSTLKGKFKLGAGHSLFRRILVVFQFAISISLIIGMAIVYRQLDHMRHLRLGFQKEQRLIIPLRDDTAPAKLRQFKTEFNAIDGVLGVSGSRMVPCQPNMMVDLYIPEGGDPEAGVVLESFSVDEDFLDVYGIQLVQGRDFMLDHADDAKEAVLLNQTAAGKLGWTDAVGHRFYKPGDANNPLLVIGVFEDIHHRPVQHAVAPAMMTFRPNRANRLTLHLQTDQMDQTLKQVREAFQRVAPDHPFDYFFLDSYYDGLFRNEERLGQIFGTFSVLAMIIGCLGLFGLVSFAAEQRTREIGIRKVLGSGTTSVVTLVSREFLLLVLGANVLAWPAAYLLMKQWLRGFPYRSPMSLDLFLLPGLGALAIALLTVSYRAIRAAHTNPVQALKHE